MKFKRWIHSRFSLLLSLDVHADLLISLPLLFLTSCRLSAWWPRRWCRDTRNFSLKGVSQREAALVRRWSLQGSSVGAAWARTIGLSHMHPSVTHAQRWWSHRARGAQMLLGLCRLSHFNPCGHFPYWITPGGVSGKYISIYFTLQQ